MFAKLLSTTSPKSKTRIEFSDHIYKSLNLTIIAGDRLEKYLPKYDVKGCLHPRTPTQKQLQKLLSLIHCQFQLPCLQKDAEAKGNNW